MRRYQVQISDMFCKFSSNPVDFSKIFFCTNIAHTTTNTQKKKKKSQPNQSSRSQVMLLCTWGNSFLYT